MMKLRWISLMALVLFLAACGDPVEPAPAAAITLAAVPPTGGLTSAGGDVALTVTVDSGTVTAVEFFEGTVSINKDTTAPFTFTKAVPANTGAAKTLTYKAVGTTDTGTVESAVKTVTQAAAGGPDPDPDPDPNGPGSGATVLATSLQEINNAPENANIVVQNNILCSKPDQEAPTPQNPDGDPCILLKAGQKLSAATPGLTITSDIPVGFGNSDDSAKITVVKMANNTAVEGFSFDGADIYRAIEAPADVTGPVFVTNVTVGATSNAPVRMVSVGPLTINGLTLTTVSSLFIQDFTIATLTNLNLTFDRAAAATGTALSINSDAATSTVIIDGLDLTTNLGGIGKDGVLIQNSADTTVGGNMTVTVRNSTVTFGAGADLANSVAFNFNKTGAGTYAILGTESTGNATNSTYQFRATYGSGVTGGPIGIQ